MRRRTVFKNHEIPGLIAELRPFLSDGKLPGGTRRWWATSGPPPTMGYLPRKYHVSVRSAVYTVFSYDTPIAWATERTDSGRDRGHPLLFHVPDISYSPTTGQHQMAVMEAWADHMRYQGTYRRFPASGREVVRVPGNAEVYGRTIRARAGGMDGIRPGEEYGAPRVERGNEEYGGYIQSPPVSDWPHHPAHP